MLKKFKFSPENQSKIEQIIAKYPSERQKSAVMALLDLAQVQNNNFLSQDCIEEVAEILSLPKTKVQEIATFYTMYNITPVGKYHIQLCGTTPCMLCGSEDILSAIENELGIKAGQTTPDNLFTLTIVECLGACSNAPMMQVNNMHYYEKLTTESVIKILQDLKSQA
jgi:NADH dehydrogenase (ubiquinone) flavoprotein 2